jgi:hypothetical protein
MPCGSSCSLSKCPSCRNEANSRTKRVSQMFLKKAQKSETESGYPSYLSADHPATYSSDRSEPGGCAQRDRREAIFSARNSTDR